MSTEVSKSAAGKAAGATSAPATFPRKTALALLSCVLVLTLVHFVRSSAGGFEPAVLGEAATLRWPHRPAAITPTVTPPVTTASKAGGNRGQTLSPISPYLIDDSRALDPFFAALDRLERHTGGPGDVVTILHYGDSPTTADLITGDARALLQARFGDAGHGFILVGKPWAWYGHRDVEIADHAWRALTGVGSMRQGVYGLGGATLVGNSDAHSTLRLHDGGSTVSAELQYLTEPNGGSVTLASNGAQVLTISTEGEADQPAARRVALPDGTRTLDLSVAGGPVKLLGLDLRSGRPGILYDSLGLNGASTTVLSRTLAMNQWTDALRHAAPSLVIVNYGTNESSFASFVHKQYEGELRLAIQRIRSALPAVPILVMSPMDRAERAGLNDLRTLPTIPEIITIQRRVAADTHCAFFDTYNAMGGDGTMARWYTGHPRLVAADFIHPTPQGAQIVARLLVDNLDLGYARWKRLHGMPVAAPAVAMGHAEAPPKTAAMTSPTPAAVRGSEARPARQEPSAPKTAQPAAKPLAGVPEPKPVDPLHPESTEPRADAVPPPQGPQ